MKTDAEKLATWNAMRHRSMLKQLAKQQGQSHKPIAKRSKNEFPVFMFAADKVFRKYVRTRDGACVTPSPECSGPLEASHVFAVSLGSIFRFDERLVHAQCQFMNQRHSSDTSELSKYVDRKYGDGFYRRMKIENKKTKKWTIPELRGIIKTYKERLDQLSGKTP